MNELIDFMAKNEPKRRKSALDAHRAEIFELHRKSYRSEQIQAFLYSIGVQVSVRYIRKFIKNNLNTQKTKEEVAQKSAEPTTRSRATQDFIDRYK